MCIHILKERHSRLKVQKMIYFWNASSLAGENWIVHNNVHPRALNNCWIIYFELTDVNCQWMGKLKVSLKQNWSRVFHHDHSWSHTRLVNHSSKTFKKCGKFFFTVPTIYSRSDPSGYHFFRSLQDFLSGKLSFFLVLWERNRAPVRYMEKYVRPKWSYIRQ